MELYMQNKEHGRMILESVEHGLLIWSTIEENCVTRTKKYAELSATEKIQADCDLKATNIILQGLPSDIYSLVNHHRVAKDLWEKVQLLMQSKKESVNCMMHLISLLTSSKFVTDVKLVKDLHISNFDQLHAYLEQHEIHANEVCKIHERSQNPLALVANHQMTPSHFNTYQSSYNNPHLAVPVFKQGDGPIDAINKMMSFLSIRRQNSYVAGTSRTRANTSGTGGNYSGQQRVVKCFNCQGECHMTRQCPKPKRKREAMWFREKVLVVKDQGNGKVLNEEELEYLADLGIVEGPVTQSVITHNATYQADDLDAYDSDCDEISTAKAVLIANLSSYGSDVLSKVPISNNTNNDMLNQSVQKMPYSEPSHFVKHPENEIQIALENKVKELDNIVCKMGQFAQTMHMLTKPQVFYVNNLKQALGFQNPFYLKKAQQIRQMLYDEEESRSKMLLKQSNPMVLEKKVNTKPINYAELNRLSEYFGKRFVPQRELSDEQALHPITDQSASSFVKIKAPRELPKAQVPGMALDCTVKDLCASLTCPGSLFRCDPFWGCYKESPISSPDPITPPAIFTSSSVLPPLLLFDPRYFFVPEELLPPKKQIRSPSSSSTTLFNSSRNQTCNLVSPSFSVYTSTPPQVFEIGKCSDKMYLKHHEKQVEDILNYLDELSLHHIEKMEEGRINSDELKTELKRIRTQIIKLQKKKLG
ncbi:retrovirus-related pol polyprotein from transposon TNT 1-94 [Tanacetum coccineum]|uniref:Retrovirus-related pol polyprotein from transposon TNT 1-94 n=1 Tax=Tanacetum coccineum TaxID=301880 RepID=A0ABQ5A992_9ASTR